MTKEICELSATKIINLLFSDTVSPYLSSSLRNFVLSTMILLPDMKIDVSELKGLEFLKKPLADKN